jgi:signal transduction histidine kinase
MLLKNSKIFDGNIRVVSDIDPRIKLTGDAQRLRQVFWNLLINACQAMPEGGAISVFAERYSRGADAEGCEIVFADTGPGIAREHLDKIFDPFFTTKTGGTGLGLAIAYRIVEDHQGTITVDSGAGKGTRFILRLPLFEDAPGVTGAGVPGGHAQKGGKAA